MGICDNCEVGGGEVWSLIKHFGIDQKYVIQNISMIDIKNYFNLLYVLQVWSMGIKNLIPLVKQFTITFLYQFIIVIFMCQDNQPKINLFYSPFCPINCFYKAQKNYKLVNIFSLINNIISKNFKIFKWLVWNLINNYYKIAH